MSLPCVSDKPILSQYNTKRTNNKTKTLLRNNLEKPQKLCKHSKKFISSQKNESEEILYKNFESRLGLDYEEILFKPRHTRYRSHLSNEQENYTKCSNLSQKRLNLCNDTFDPEHDLSVNIPVKKLETKSEKHFSIERTLFKSPGKAKNSKSHSSNKGFSVTTFQPSNENKLFHSELEPISLKKEHYELFSKKYIQEKKVKSKEFRKINNSNKKLFNFKTFIDLGSQENNQVQIRKNKQLEKISSVKKQKESINENDSNSDSNLIIREKNPFVVTREMLLKEIKTSYKGLIRLESHVKLQDNICEKFDINVSFSDKDHEKFRKLSELHGALLFLYINFLSLTQHPSACHSIMKIPIKYTIPARLWKNSIYAYLEILRSQLPYTIEHLISYILFSYSQITVLLETASTFKNEWMECLGDLARYRMAIEEIDMKTKNHWSNISKYWYIKVLMNLPTLGRLYHHLAILSKDNILKKLFYYSKALVVSKSFSSARGSILSLFDPIFIHKESSCFSETSRNSDLINNYVKLHGLLFTQLQLDNFETILNDLLSLLNKENIWNKEGVLMAITNIVALFQYGNKHGKLKYLIKESRINNKKKKEETHFFDKDYSKLNQEYLERVTTVGNKTDILSYDLNKSDLPAINHSLFKTVHITSTLYCPISLINSSDLSRSRHSIKDQETLPIDHIVFLKACQLHYFIMSLSISITSSNSLAYNFICMIFLYYCSKYSYVLSSMERFIPWLKIAEYLSNIIKKINYDSILEMSDLPVRQNKNPLPEDWALRGINWTEKIWPKAYFENMTEDDFNFTVEQLNDEVTEIRIKRIIWLGFKIVSLSNILLYNNQTQHFTISREYINKIKFSNKYYGNVILSLSDTDAFESENDNYKNNIKFNDDLEVQGESEEIRNLRERRRALKSILSKNDSKKLEFNHKKDTQYFFRQIKSGYTTLVFDTNFLISYLKLFRKILSMNSWDIVIPLAVIFELYGLNNKPPPIGITAYNAIILIISALKTQKAKIVTVKGNILHALDYISEQPEDIFEDEKRYRNIDDRIIQVALSQNENHVKFQKELFTSEEFEKVVLVTSDLNMRIIAKAKGLSAISAIAFKKIIKVGNSNSLLKTKLAFDSNIYN
ncbi:hypothetical protein T552_02038 [Pneumocystis carinii B80]|uniref:PIN domain-containing protein n=1 Tax=Pneumocystis carinii (strain B80) TaxID=1408658 RepID=A0A0W4ZIJ0_PNEC8|nr:hypothetical protein T552_02038 [Pneumocystis carinii B80]KTW28179.1 hypothetical protein T552_02038 [Pneumocystis carinii B80]